MPTETTMATMASWAPEGGYDGYDGFGQEMPQLWWQDVDIARGAPFESKLCM